MASNVNPDLSKERKSATFDSEKLTELIYGGKEALKRRRYLYNTIFQDKFFKSLKPWWNRSREEQYDLCVRRGAYLQGLYRKLNIDTADRYYVIEAAIPHEVDPLGVHSNMFMTALEKHATKEQLDKYLEPAKQYKLIGTYAQTELGHGTFIRGLETTATYDPKTEEFVIHSPTITSMKYWPSALGKTSTHVLLMAQLYTGGKCRGLHSFVVQIRSLEDHALLPGVQSGDIGNKLAFGGTDNGYIMFDNHRVPRDAMLMRYAKVEKDGTYKPPSNSRIAYGTMVFVRANIVGNVASCLAKACVIATRYSAVRRQTEVKPGGEEPQVLDYQTQQDKLFPLIGASYALMFTSYVVKKEFTRISENIDRGDMEEMQVLHALAAGLKALSSDITSDGIDVLRKSCGGHGYTHASGIPKIWAYITPACTYEGENTVMYLQCGRYLVKCFGLAARGHQLPGPMQYLNKPLKQFSQLKPSLDIEDLIEAYEHTTSRLVKEAALRLQTLVKRGTSVEDARNQTGVLLVKAAKAYSRTFVFKTLVQVLQRPNIDANVAGVLKALCQLFAVCGITTQLGDFIQDGYISSQQADMLMSKQLDLYAELRPNAVALVDAFDYPDEILQSCLGRYDGNVYEALYEYAKGSPLNKDDVLESYHSTLKPLMRGQLFQGDRSAKL